MSLTERDVVTRDTPIHMKPPRWRVIIAETCSEFSISPDTILRPYGPRRYMPIRVTLARRLSSAGYGYAQIGRWLYRDHSTILWYCGRRKINSSREVVNSGAEPIPPPTSDFVRAARRRAAIDPWISSKWITARALATATGYSYDRVRADLKAMAADGKVVRSGYDRPVQWRRA